MNEQVTESEIYKELEREWSYARKQASYWNGVAIEEREKRQQTQDNLNSSHLYNDDISTERNKLRKALEEAVRMYEHGNMESDFEKVLEGMYEVCKAALEEGESE